MNFNDIRPADFITWAGMLIGAGVAWGILKTQVAEMNKRIEAHELACAEKNSEAAKLRAEQARLQSDTVTQLASLATSVRILLDEVKTLNERQYRGKHR